MSERFKFMYAVRGESLTLYDKKDRENGEEGNLARVPFKGDLEFAVRTAVTNVLNRTPGLSSPLAYIAENVRNPNDFVLGRCVRTRDLQEAALIK